MKKLILLVLLLVGCGSVLTVSAQSQFRTKFYSQDTLKRTVSTGAPVDNALLQGRETFGY